MMKNIPTFFQFNIDDMRDAIKVELSDEECLYHVFDNLPILSEDDLGKIIEKYDLQDDKWLFSKFPDTNWLHESIDAGDLIPRAFQMNEVLSQKADKYDINDREIVMYLSEKLKHWSVKDLLKFQDGDRLNEYIFKNILTFVRGYK